MAKKNTYMTIFDIEALKKIIIKKGNVALSKAEVSAFAVAYYVSESAVRYRVGKILKSLYKAEDGSWKIFYRPTMGPVSEKALNKISQKKKADGMIKYTKRLSKSLGITSNTVRMLSKDLV
jgi:hypothetical protein